MMLRQSLAASRRHSSGRQASGFSLIELVVAMAVFVVIAGTAISLFRQHVPIFSQTQNKVALNTSIRNALAQLQIDAVNAGTNNVPGFNVRLPIGLTIANAAGGNGCHAAGTTAYGAGCFDTLSIIAADGTPPSHPTNGAGGCADLTIASLFLTPQAGTTPAQLAADFHSGDQLMFVDVDGSQIATTVLTANGAASGSNVQLQHTPVPLSGSNTSSNDPLGITTSPPTGATPTTTLGTSFCAADWVFNLTQNSVSYSVDTATDPNNPRLMRTKGGNADVVAEQVIGFKVGAATWNNATATSSDFYDFNAADYGFDYGSIRSIRVSLIVRSSPAATDANDPYRNAFDGAPYRIQAMSVAINPRNLSMQDR
ncbi:MAG TPA: prepilin-type N-terminal cleavage/methylation domain-containing protein [Candidatus Acidoferrales bacterium]|nr:prepilin-type N-terminal cleavage/methylation domain-containing protein [Candidatus Acidoferrales bacterium]